MRSHFSILLLITAILPVTGDTVASSPTVSPSASDGVQVIEVNAKKYDFSPSPIRVKQGTKVQLKITATDRSHGFRIKEYPEGAAKSLADRPHPTEARIRFSPLAPQCLPRNDNPR